MKKLITALVLFAASTSPAPAQQAPRPQPRPRFIRMATAIGDDYFDGKDTRARVRRHLKIAKQLGVQYLRCAFSWNGIEPKPGEYRFAFWDMLIAEAEKAGIKLIPYVAYTPEWAARTPNDFWKQPPKDPTNYARLMGTLAARYRRHVYSWELWNEPDNNEYWQGTPDDFAEMVIPAADAVRLADPAAKVVLGGMSRGPGDFFRALLTKDKIQQSFDTIAIHAYPESWHEERAETVFEDWVPQVEAMLHDLKKAPALWLNEMGYADYRYQPNHASLWGTNTYYRYEHTSRYSADFLLKSFLMAAATGEVALAGWYRIDDFREGDPRMPSDKVHDHLGVERVDGKLKPSFYAFRLFNNLLGRGFQVADGTLKVERPENSQAVTHSFLRPDGRIVVTGWLRSSQFGEVPAHTGLLADRRQERISIQLPCATAQVKTYNSVGNVSGTNTVKNYTLGSIKLAGDHIYLAVVTCEVPAPSVHQVRSSQ